MLKDKKIRLGILGCGAVAYRWYLKGLCGDKESYRVVAVCDVDKKRAQQAASDYNVGFNCSTKDELLNFGIDAVLILTRHKDHFEHIKFFLENNVHVYSEKPFAENYQDGQKLVALAKSKGLKFGSAPQIMLSSRNIKTKQLINSGLIGKITLVRASCSNLGPAGRLDTDYDPEWFYNEGGSLASLGIYGLSALLWIMGKPEKISCFQGIAYPNREVLYGPAKDKQFRVTAPDNVTAMLDFGEGCFALFDGSYSVANPPKYDFEIHGTKGSLLVGGFGGPASILHCTLEKVSTEVGPDDNCHLTWNLSWGVEDMLNAILENIEPAASADFALGVIDVMDKMHVSANQSVIVKVWYTLDLWKKKILQM